MLTRCQGLLASFLRSFARPRNATARQYIFPETIDEPALDGYFESFRGVCFCEEAAPNNRKTEWSKGSARTVIVRRPAAGRRRLNVVGARQDEVRFYPLLVPARRRRLPCARRAWPLESNCTLRCAALSLHGCD